MRRSLLCGTAAVTALLVACGTPITIDSSVQITTTAPPSTAPTTTVTPTSTPDASAPSTGQTIELDQYGLRFQLSSRWHETPAKDLDFEASTRSPRGLFSISGCEGCAPGLVPREGETRTEVVIDGVSAVVIENAAIGLPESITANELIVVDDQRAFSVIMSFEGDIGPEWDEFISSIEFTDVETD